MDSQKPALTRLEAVFEDGPTVLRVRVLENGMLELFEDTDGPGLYITIQLTDFVAVLEALRRHVGV